MLYGQPDGAISVSDTRLTNDEARRISKLIPASQSSSGREGSEQGQEPSQATAALLQAGDDRDLIREGKLLEVHCGNCRPDRRLYLDPEILRLPKRMPVPEVARQLVCSKCGARNSETYNPIWARPDARVGGMGHYPDFSAKKP